MCELHETAETLMPDPAVDAGDAIARHADHVEGSADLLRCLNSDAYPRDDTLEHVACLILQEIQSIRMAAGLLWSAYQARETAVTTLEKQLREMRDRGAKS